MTHTLQPPTIDVDAIDQTSRIVAVDAIRNAVDDYGLPFPATIQFSPGVDGPFAIYFDYDAERDAWKSAIDGGRVFTGRPTAALSTQRSREESERYVCPNCHGDVTHQSGCPVQIRRELVEAVSDGPSELLTFPVEAIRSAVEEGLIEGIAGKGETGRTSYVRVARVDIYDDARIEQQVTLGSLHADAPNRVDLDAAAQIPVVVVETCSYCGGLVVAHEAGCTYALPRRTPGAALVDNPAPGSEVAL